MLPEGVTIIRTEQLTTLDAAGAVQRRVRTYFAVGSGRGFYVELPAAQFTAAEMEKRISAYAEELKKLQPAPDASRF